MGVEAPSRLAGKHSRMRDEADKLAAAAKSNEDLEDAGEKDSCREKDGTVRCYERGGNASNRARGSGRVPPRPPKAARQSPSPRSSEAQQ